MVLPKRNKKLLIQKPDKEQMENNFVKMLKERIKEVFDELKQKFINDPIYEMIIDYFIKSGKDCELTNVPQEIKFYEKYVDNFLEFKRIFTISNEVEEYSNIIQNENENLKRLKLIKEKYQYILKNLQKYLSMNQENYQEYYDEWKKKNEKLVVKDYELDNLKKDIEKLIPKNADYRISGRDKRNFILILYLFQKLSKLKNFP